MKTVEQHEQELDKIRGKARAMNDAELIKRLLEISAICEHRNDAPTLQEFGKVSAEAAARLSSMTADVKMPEEPICNACRGEGKVAVTSFVDNARKTLQTCHICKGAGKVKIDYDTLRSALTSALAQLEAATIENKRLNVRLKNCDEMLKEAAESRGAASEEQIEEIAISHAEQWWLKQNNGEFPNLNFAIADAVAEALSIASRKTEQRANGIPVP